MASPERSSKRKRQAVPEADDSDNFSDVQSTLSDDEVDISAALTGQKPGQKSRHTVSNDDDEDLQGIIRESIAKRDVKGGTELLKKTKGKGKMAKGEVGGGSFQSMGTSHNTLPSTWLINDEFVSHN